MPQPNSFFGLGYFPFDAGEIAAKFVAGSGACWLDLVGGAIFVVDALDGVPELFGCSGHDRSIASCRDATKTGRIDFRPNPSALVRRDCGRSKLRRLIESR
jgi:hypothetical protein